MATILLIIEGGAIFVSTSAAMFFGAYDTVDPFAQAFIFSLCCLVTFYYNDLYEARTVRRLSLFAPRLPKALGIASLMTFCCYALIPRPVVAAGPFVSSLLLAVGLLALIRTLFYRLMQGRSFLERVLIMGATPLASALIKEFEAHPNYTVLGVVGDVNVSHTPLLHAPLLGSCEDLGKIIEKARPDRIVIALTERRKQLAVQQLLDARVCGIVVEDGSDVYERLTGKLAMESITPTGVIFSKDFRKSRFDQAAGRALSFLASAIGLIVFAPLFGLIALAIKLDTPGPVFFVQDRIGLGGRRFMLIKFRTMHPARGNTSEWAKDNGDRITRVGKWLRKFRLDELPQFVNILRGDMNLVGPRPHPASNLDLLVLVSRNVPECGEPIPYYSLRWMVRPGVTGWAQVRYRYANDLEEEIEKMHYDLYYVKHLSIWLDLRILLDTVKIVLMGHGTGVDDADRPVMPPRPLHDVLLNAKPVSRSCSPVTARRH
jgi:exopolysaccharide biosynthesis polyprenyl glycosylphosphotransferase